MDVKTGWLGKVAVCMSALALSGCAKEPYSLNDRNPGVVLFTKLDSATVTVDVPRGIALASEGNRLTLATRQGTRTVQTRAFPLSEVSHEARVDGERRYVLSMGTELTEELLDFWKNGGRLMNYRASLPASTGITPGLALCRTETIPDGRPAVVVARVWIESLPDIDPMPVDLREVAQGEGAPLNAAFEPCASGR